MTACGYRSRIAGALLLILGALPASVQSDEAQVEETVTVEIRGREFLPATAILHRGRKTRLVLVNRDSELHTFAPSGLLAGVSLNVAGNGAPEFGADGFKRVVIPPEGTAEIRFIPATPGQYRYVCDMPGHQMSAAILVE